MENELDVIKEQHEKVDDPSQFWEKIIDIGKNNDPHPYWDHFAKFDINSEVQAIVSYLKTHLAAEPIPAGIKHIYFGLFEAGNDESPAGFYICGSNIDEDEDGDFLCDPEWFPEWRYFHSTLLNDVMFAAYGALFDEDEDSADDEIDDEDLEVFDYFLMLGAATAIVKGIVREIFINQNIFVGFDSGDYLKVKSD